MFFSAARDLPAHCLSQDGLDLSPRKKEQEDSRDVENVVRLLEGANADQGLRYFSEKGRGFPELSWVRDTVENLISAVEPSVKNKAADDGVISGRAVKMDLVCGKPTRKV